MKESTTRGQMNALRSHYSTAARARDVQEIQYQLIGDINKNYTINKHLAVISSGFPSSRHAEYPQLSARRAGEFSDRCPPR